MVPITSKSEGVGSTVAPRYPVLERTQGSARKSQTEFNAPLRYFSQIRDFKRMRIWRIFRIFGWFIMWLKVSGSSAGGIGALNFASKLQSTVSQVIFHFPDEHVQFRLYIQPHIFWKSHYQNHNYFIEAVNGWYSLYQSISRKRMSPKTELVLNFDFWEMHYWYERPSNSNIK